MSARTFQDSLSKQRADSLFLNQPVKFKISVSPEAASNASVAIVRKSKIELSRYSISTLPISPDTIGTWNAPLSLLLFRGDYDFIATKPGFRQAEESVRLGDDPPDSITIEMLSFTYLRRKYDAWGRYKWISAGVAAGAGLATWYFYNRIGTYSSRYNTAVVPSDIQADKNGVRSSRNLYRVSSAVAFTAVGSFLVTWIIQSICNK